MQVLVLKLANLCDFYAILQPVGEKFSTVIGEKFLFFDKIFTPDIRHCAVAARESGMSIFKYC